MKTRTLARRAIPITATMAGLTVTAIAIPTESPKVGAERWVASLAPEALATLIEAKRVAALPPEYRRALSRALRSPEDQARFWKVVVTAYREAHALSSDQLEVLARVEAMITPTLFDPNKTDVERARALITEARKTVIAAIGDEADQMIFRAAGTYETDDSPLNIAERVRFAWRTHRPAALVQLLKAAVPVLQATDCNCADDGDCYYSTHCNSSTSCSMNDPGWPSGCGSWNSYPCSWLCSY